VHQYFLVVFKTTGKKERRNVRIHRKLQGWKHNASARDTSVKRNALLGGKKETTEGNKMKGKRH
jgi:hypothetical protein